MRREGLFGILAIVLIVLIAELLGVALFALEHHRPVYSEPPEPPVKPPQVIVQIHPYFGFIYSPTTLDREKYEKILYREGFNFDAGFAERHPEYVGYPTPRTNDKVLLIGIFGSSLANTTAFLAQRNDWLAGVFADVPEYHDREPIVLNFAIPGHKQPQPNQILAYFAALGQPLDIVVNIDGFNEKDMLWVFNDLNPTFPNLWATLRASHDRPESLGTEKARVLQLYHQVAAEAASPEDCRFGLCYGFARFMQTYHRLMIPKAGSETLSHFAWSAPPKKDERDNGVDLWVDSSLEMAKIAKGMGATYLHVLHPNQWFRKRDDFKPSDPKWAQQAVAIKIAYPRFVKAGAERLAPQLNFLDATGILDERLDVYQDDCCHLNELGSKMLIMAIVDELKRISARKAAH